MADPKPKYRELKQQLDSILSKLESGDLDIDEASQLYEEGSLVIKKLEKYLDATKNTKQEK